jgi:methylmalonyl-CoA mutase
MQGLIQRKVAATRAVREQNLARRKEVLTGATEFPNLHEASVAVLDARPTAPAPSVEAAAITFEALAPMRLATPFEELRDRSDQILKDKGARPKIFLANLGTPADFTARATFAKSFFETGGVEAVEFLPSRDAASPPPLASGEVKDLAAAFKTSGAALACLCSSDKVYADQAAAAARALQAAGAKHIYLAGRPGAQEAALRAAGVNDFVFAGGDVLAMLRETYRLME